MMVFLINISQTTPASASHADAKRKLGKPAIWLLIFFSGHVSLTVRNLYEQ